MEPYVKVWLWGVEEPIVIMGATSAHIAQHQSNNAELMRVRFTVGDKVLADFKYDQVVGWEATNMPNGFPIK